MGRLRRLLAIATILLSTPAGVDAAPTWLRLESRNFVLVGTVPERTLRDIASRLEQFRDVFGRVVPRNRGLAALPTVVVVFRDERSYKPYWPVRQGKPIEVAGLFVPAPDVNYVSLNTAAGESVYRIIFHEYSHFILGNVFASPPLWLNEGVAEYNATFEATRSGDRADVGAVIPEYVQFLRANRLLPTSELLAVDETSPLYNESERRSVFYAQSWALVHYLALGNDARKGQLNAFFNLLNGGTPQTEAFRQAFGCEPAQMDTELSNYVQQQVFRRITVRLKEPIAVDRVGTLTMLSEAEANAYLGDLLARVGRGDEARSKLEALVKTDPTVARAHGALGMLDVREGRASAAVPRMREAVALNGSDAGFQYGLGAALLWSARTGEEATDPERVAEAKAALTRAIGLEPEFADAYAHLGLLALLDGNNEQARTLIARALALVPSRLAYRLFLAQAYVESANYAAARPLLVQVQSSSIDPELRSSAKRMLDDLDRRAHEAPPSSKARPAPDRAAAPVAPGARAADDLNRRGCQAYDDGRYQEAEQLLRRATESDPGHRWAWNNLGRALSRLDRTVEAIEAYKRQIAVSPRDEYAHGNLAAALWRSKDYPAAEREFLVHLEIKPDDEWALDQLVRLQATLNRPGDALATLENAAARPGARPVLLLRAAVLASALGARQKALASVTQVLQGHPGAADLAEASLLCLDLPSLAPRAGDLATEASSAALAGMKTLDLAQASNTYRPLVYALAIAWTTTGKLALDRKELTAGEQHLRAAWELMPHPITAATMAQLQSAKGTRSSSIDWFAIASAYGPGADMASAPLRELVPNATKRDALVAAARAKWSPPTIPVPALQVSSGASAELMLSIDRAGRVDACHVVRADDALAEVGPKLVGLAVYTPVEGHEIDRLVRAALVSCGADGKCGVVFRSILAPGDTPMFVR